MAYAWWNLFEMQPGVSETMKLRINTALKDLADACASSMGEPLSEFIRIAVKCEKAGKFSGVEHDEKLTDATRKKSTVITIKDLEDDPGYLRRCLSRATKYCEPQMPEPFETPLIENVHYRIANEW